MHFPSFWARRSHGSATCWRWSDRSTEDAATLADAAARALAQRVARDGWPTAGLAVGERQVRLTLKFACKRVCL